jgi:hypothetical protein
MGASTSDFSDIAATARANFYCNLRISASLANCIHVAESRTGSARTLGSRKRDTEHDSVSHSDLQEGSC